MSTRTTDPFALFVDQAIACHDFMAGMRAMAAMTQAAQQARPYQPTEQSSSATRKSLGAMGLSHIPGGRSRRLSATKRAELAAKESARQTGFVNGRFVGGKAA